MLELDCPVHGKEAAALVQRAIDNDTLISAQPPGRCELCRTVAETRPYGPKGEQVCFDCGMKDESAARAQFEKRMGPA